MMPDMSGYEVCEQLKADESMREIPIIFISALNEVFDKVKAFDLGGVDYITKPFQPEEVLARVETHLALRNLQKDLQQKNSQLQQEILERTHAENALRKSEQELRELNASKDKFFSIIAHDLKGPLSSLKDLIRFTEEHLESYRPEKLREIVMLQRSATENLFKLLENLLTWSRIQRGKVEFIPQQIDLRGVIVRTMELFAPTAEQKQITLRNLVQEEVNISVDLNMIDTVIRNLIANALKFTHPGGTVEIRAQRNEKNVEVSITDSGIGIAQEHLSKLFRIEAKFKRLGTAREKGTGLGLILCREFVEKHDGRIWVESEVGKGSTFKFTVPTAPKT
jgi:signal transduction histidine kinase